MRTPEITVLGVYRLKVTEQLVLDKLSMDYLPEDQNVSSRETVLDELNKIVLIEVLIRDRGERFSVDHFLHDPPNEVSIYPQAAWSEVFLTHDGERTVPTEFGKSPPGTDVRVAFFMHLWEPLRPLNSTYGRVACPRPELMPERLQRVIPYELPD